MEAIETIIKREALALGFYACGITDTSTLKEADWALQSWLAEGYQGEMSFMERNSEKRATVSELIPWGRSAIVCIQNYLPEKYENDGTNPLIARYAQGDDYHKIVKDKLHYLLLKIREFYPEVKFRALCDSAPLIEKSLAVKAGLGWIGKNTLLLTRKGSWYFIGELVVDIELKYDTPYAKDYCGTCTRCLDACPTQAFVKEGVLDARKCISYLTIESRQAIPAAFAGKMENRVFGCDICQEVCPHNRKAIPHTEQLLSPRPELLKMDWEAWQRISETEFEDKFSNSAISRTGWSGMQRNVHFVEQQLTKSD